ncbi:interferon-stimulated 20 kDa exonuclease-like 2 isoform X2 [Cololabis saira]|uniref:interferon-stimulated 20 kDa exonuclease-like 2 isoform X2 n=1 Tax=Cololabis saira TaxID=129043 RepID=UPI002AD205E5|nr:interferon-stimulated 20 kDa exonuclease-like 2 isoform X2 [Cololabis saira]
MSDVSVKVFSSDDPSQRRNSAEKRKRKSKKFHKKMQYLEAKGYLKSPQKCNDHTGASTRDHSAHQNSSATECQPSPIATQNKHLPRHTSAAREFPCSSRPSLTFNHYQPSLTFTVNNKGSHEKPKEPANTATKATTGTVPSASSSRQPPSAAAGKPSNPLPAGSSPSVSSSHKPSSSSAGNPTKYLALDCEMVGVGPKGRISQLARCSIVSYEGDVVYDKFIHPTMPVTDYRTRWSGIRPRDLVNATTYPDARKEILRLLVGRVVIGHAVHNDFKALGYSHPPALTRDTSRIPLLNRRAGFAENEVASLKRLTKAIFNRDIQVGRKGHCSVEDARASMELYKVVEEEWERTLGSKSLDI